MNKSLIWLVLLTSIASAQIPSKGFKLKKPALITTTDTTALTFKWDSTGGYMRVMGDIIADSITANRIIAPTMTGNQILDSLNTANRIITKRWNFRDTLSLGDTTRVYNEIGDSSDIRSGTVKIWHSDPPWTGQPYEDRWFTDTLNIRSPKLQFAIQARGVEGNGQRGYGVLWAVLEGGAGSVLRLLGRGNSSPANDTVTNRTEMFGADNTGAFRIYPGNGLEGASLSSDSSLGSRNAALLLNGSKSISKSYMNDAITVGTIGSAATTYFELGIDSLGGRWVDPDFYFYGGLQFALPPNRNSGTIAMSNKVNALNQVIGSISGFEPHQLLKVERYGLYNTGYTKFTAYDSTDDIESIGAFHFTNAASSVQPLAVGGIKIETKLGGDQAGRYFPTLAYGISVENTSLNFGPTPVRNLSGIRIRTNALGSAKIDTSIGIIITDDTILSDSSGATPINNSYGIFFNEKTHVSGDNYAIQFGDTGKVRWGTDTKLRRSAAKTITLDSNLTVTKKITSPKIETNELRSFGDVIASGDQSFPKFVSYEGTSSDSAVFGMDATGNAYLYDHVVGKKTLKELISLRGQATLGAGDSVNVAGLTGTTTASVPVASYAQSVTVSDAPVWAIVWVNGTLTIHGTSGKKVNYNVNIP